MPPRANQQAQPVLVQAAAESYSEDSDLVDRIFDYVVELIPEMRPHAQVVKDAVRHEFAGIEVYVGKRSSGQRLELARQVLALFNGRNSYEVARRLNISRATVFRLLKQAGGIQQAKPSQFSEK